jgi:hypothetical protein
MEITTSKKVCRLCGDEKYINEFHKKKGTKDGHRNECKECVKGIQKKYADPEKRKEYDKKRYDENREQILDRKKEYHKENREKILNDKEQYRNDPKNKDKIKDYLENYREEHREEAKEYVRNNSDKNSNGQARYRENHPHIIAWRSILYSTLKRLNTEKSDHTIKLLGYTADDLKLHIENQFTEGMAWDNHGEWHRSLSSSDKVCGRHTSFNYLCFG